MKKLTTLALLLIIGAQHLSAQQADSLTVVKCDSAKVESLKQTTNFMKGTLTITEKDTNYVSYVTSGVAVMYSGEKALEMADKDKIRPSKRWFWTDGHWSGVSINYTGLGSGLFDGSLPDDAQWMGQATNSVGVDVNLIDAVIFGYGCVGVVTGLGMEVNNFRFRNPIAFTRDATGALSPDLTTYSGEDTGWQKSKLTTAYVQIPLLLEFHFWDDAWVNFGVVGAWCYESYTKVKSEKYGIKKNWRDTNVAALRYGFEMNLGIKAVNIKAKYYPKSIFVEGLAPDVKQFNIGIGVTLW